jgi:DNA repair exonuclease SbcCD ATPase subunit
MNPKLQNCLQEYKFDIYNNEEQKIIAAITSFQQLVPSDLPSDKLDIFEEHFENALGTFALVKKLQKTEKEYDLFAKDYRDLHFSVRKKEKKIRKIDKRIKKLEAEIRNLDKDNVSEKNKIELKIEDYKLEIEEITKQIPENWLSKNKEFEIILKAKNTRTKRYRKNVDQAYDNLDQIAMFIKEHEKLNELSSEINNLKKNIVKEDYEHSISIIDSLFEKIGEISGTEEFANRLDDLYSLIDSEEKDINKISEANSEAIILFDKEVKWRKDAAKNLMPELEKYNLVIKDNIGLRLQSRLTKDQAKFVAKCNSIHRDISLNF